MKTENSVLISRAKDSLNGKWGLAIGGYLLYYAIVTVLALVPKVGILAVIVIGGPFLLGLQTFFLAIARNEEARIEQIFSGFDSFGKALGTYLLMFLYIILWSLLLIVPGIIAAFSYAMTFFIMADDPHIGASEALRKSKQMMEGNKGKYFMLMLPFIVIPLLMVIVYLSIIIVAGINHDYITVMKYSAYNNTLTGKLITPAFSILLSWVIVWMYTASAKFYEDIKPKDVIWESDLVAGE